MQLDRIGRGERAVFLRLGRDQSDGADAGGGKAEAGPDLAREGGDRGLAAGAGNRGDGLRLARKKPGGGYRQRMAGIRHRHESDAGGQALRALLGGDRDGAGFGRGAREMRAIGLGAGNGDKQKARLDLAAVGSDAGNLERRGARIDARQ